MAGMYAATYNGTISTNNGDADLGLFRPAADCPIRLRGFLLSQISEVGDSAEEGLRITVRRMASTLTVTGGTSITAIKPMADFTGGSTWLMTATANHGTVTTTNGTSEVCGDLGWNERNSPYDFWYPDERFAPQIKKNGSSDQGVMVRQETTPADDYTGCFTFWIEEMG